MTLVVYARFTPGKTLILNVEDATLVRSTSNLIDLE
jgi:hypothetical protein